MGGLLKTTDRHPALAIKEACLARSGVYLYTYDEMLARGYTPPVKKAVYKEFRPNEVLERCKDKFGLTAVTVEHTPDETSHYNFRNQAVGVVGDNLSIKPMSNGEIGIFGKIAFYTRDGFEYYKQGNRETSADYRSVCVPDESGKYDFILRDIQSVNGVVITSRGRGGPSVRIQDSAAYMVGGITMAGKKGVLSFLGIGRTKDESFKLSKVVLDGVKTLHTLDAAGKERLVGEIMGHVVDLNDGEQKEQLIGAIKDSLNNPLDVAKQEEKVARVIDGLYDACLTLGDAEAQEYLKSLAEGKTQDTTAADDKAKDAKVKDDKTQDTKAADGKTKDSLTTDQMIDAIVAKVNDSVGSLIDVKIKEALGIKEGAKTQDGGTATHTEDGGLDEYIKEEGSFLLDSAFGL